jgi:hypothetical protein
MISEMRDLMIGSDWKTIAEAEVEVEVEVDDLMFEIQVS